MTIELDHLVDDIIGIMFEDLDTRLMKEFEGSRIDWKALTEGQRRCLTRMVYDAYQMGAKRVCEAINEDADRQVKRAQDKALKKILNGKY